MKQEIAVGIVVILAMIVLGYFTIIMSGEIIDTHKYYPMTVVFKDVEGLSKDDKVRINGVLSGYVDSVDLIDNHVVVKLRLYNHFTLYENYEIIVRNETALAGKYVSINPGTAMDEHGKQYAVITTRENLIGTSVPDPFTMLSRLIADNRGNVNATVKNLRDITDKINTGKGTLGKIINEDTAHAQATDLIKQLQDTIEDTREQAPITSFLRAALTAF
ncbi:MAG: MlaD family protein [Spirochaetes bacterium]|nr:MlaD family protein [Spirochaetota bacterium]